MSYRFGLQCITFLAAHCPYHQLVDTSLAAQLMTRSLRMLEHNDRRVVEHALLAISSLLASRQLESHSLLPTDMISPLVRRVLELTNLAGDTESVRIEALNCIGSVASRSVLLGPNGGDWLPELMMTIARALGAPNGPLICGAGLRALQMWIKSAYQLLHDSSSSNALADSVESRFALQLWSLLLELDLPQPAIDAAAATTMTTMTATIPTTTTVAFPIVSQAFWSCASDRSPQFRSAFCTFIASLPHIVVVHVSVRLLLL